MSTVVLSADDRVGLAEFGRLHALCARSEAKPEITLDELETWNDWQQRMCAIRNGASKQLRAELEKQFGWQ